MEFETSERRHGKAPIWQEFGEHLLMKLREVESPTWVVRNTSSPKCANIPFLCGSGHAGMGSGGRWGGSEDANRSWLQRYLSKDLQSKPSLVELLEEFGKPLS